MGYRCPKPGGRIKADAERYFAVGGGTDQNGQPIEQPIELGIAEIVDGMAQRYGCPPSVILDEPVSMLPIVELALMAESDKAKKQEEKSKSR